VTGVRSHLSNEILMDVLEGAAARGPAAEHLASCAECAARLAEAREGLALTRAVDVPEPPGMYWQSFPRQVAGRLAAAPAPRWRAWLLPGLATAMAVAAAVIFLPRPAPEAPPTPAPTLAAWSALPPAEEDPALPVLQALGPELDPALDCAGVAECLAELTDEESQDLVQTLRASSGKESLL
jgi:anti-sigma factor RsiW